MKSLDKKIQSILGKKIVDVPDLKKAVREFLEECDELVTLGSGDIYMLLRKHFGSGITGGEGK